MVFFQQMLNYFDISQFQCHIRQILQSFNKVIKQLQHMQSVDKPDSNIEQHVIIFNDYQKHFTTYFIPVYAQAVIQDIVSIDYDRNTVTANFVIYFTICHKIKNDKGDSETKNSKISQFVKNHWHLQFGYNTTIFYPQSVSKDCNNSFIITEVIAEKEQEAKKQENNCSQQDSFKYNSEDYRTFKIQGNFQCPAKFNLFFFPYKEIKVQNYFCFRSQRFNFGDDPNHTDFVQIKYNIMQLKTPTKEDMETFKFIKYEQFYSRFPKDNNNKNKIKDKFRAYYFKHDESMKAWSYFDRLSKQSQQTFSLKQKLLQILKVPIKTSASKNLIVENKKDNQIITDIFKNRENNFIQDRKRQINQSFMQNQQQYEYQKNINNFNQNKVIKNSNVIQFECSREIYQSQYLSSSKYMVMNFRLYCFKTALILKEEVPIWILSIVSLFLFHSPYIGAIGSRYSNIILLLVSYISVITNFRSNNVAQSDITLFEIKTMSLAILPFLLLITSTIDFYNPPDPPRQNQMSNPFAIVSLILVIVEFVITICMLVYKFNTSSKKIQTIGRQARDEYDHINCVKDFSLWQHNKLRRKLIAMHAIEQVFKDQKKIIQKKEMK